MQVSDTTAIEEMAKKIIVDNPKAVADYKKNPQSLGFLIGQLMRASSGTANPELSREILEKLLK
jgi:aspartyl-tRNA(Asn)/glutamyl-tRNA(Gln) amidotransferase subunit B